MATSSIALDGSRSARFLRARGWVPFVELDGESVWVSPDGELEFLFDAVRIEVNRARSA